MEVFGGVLLQEVLMSEKAALTVSKKQKDLLVKQYEAIKTVSQARLDLANVRLQLARNGDIGLIVLDW
jgi:hypothetical protein